MNPVHPRQFASDNCSGACPEVMAALQSANEGHVLSYGDDPVTARAEQLTRDLFETDCEVFFVFNGTSANALSVAAMCQSYDRVICYEHAHLATDECGAPGLFSHGTTLQGIDAPRGKLTPDRIDEAVRARSDIHHNKAAALSITQATELGTVYSVDEVKALGEMATQHRLRFHMDGARFANALAGLNCSPRAITWEAGLDVLSLGGTKNGLLCAEAVVFFNKELARDFKFRRKQAGQLASKMRFLSAQWIGALESGAWQRNARHANLMTGRLEQGLRQLPQVRILYPRQVNAVFVALPGAATARLREQGWHFYTDVGPDGAARLMCSWDTTESDIDQILADIAAAVK